MTTDPKGLAERFASMKYRPEMFGADDAIPAPSITSAERDLIVAALSQPHAEAVAIKAALNTRDLFINPHLLDKAADEIDCCPGCDSEWDGNCRKEKRGDYCPNDLAETLRAVAKVALATPPAAQPQTSRETEIVRLINELRANEGNSVTIPCDNPDFNGQPNCAVICNGDWTDWQDKRFAADTLLDALSMAFVESKLPTPRKVVAESNGHHWIERFNLVCCRDCGFVRRADDKNKPCKGVVKVGLREDADTRTRGEPESAPPAPSPAKNDATILHNLPLLYKE